MLGFIDNQLVAMEPLPVTGDFRVEVTRPDIKGRGRIYVKFDGQPIEAGVRFFLMDGKPRVCIDPITGRYTCKPGARGKIRVIFAGQHRDVEIKS